MKISSGVAFGAAAAAAAGFWIRSVLREKKKCAPSATSSTASCNVNNANVSSFARSEETEELLREQFSRNEQFFGKEAQKKLEDSFVVVVGLGGVGSHAAHMLVRSGVRKIRMIDFDQVSLSSLNRHAVATHADVGTPKATALVKHLLEFAPHCRDTIDAQVAMFDGEHAEEMLAGNPDFVLDCIDDVATKIDLLKYCADHGIRVLSSMGAGAKADPTRLHLATLGDVCNDPLAAKLKWRLKKSGLSSEKTGAIQVIYSSEKPRMKLLPLSAEQSENPDEYGAMPNFRVRVIPVLGTMPAIFGMAMASFAATELAGIPIDPQPVPEVSRNVVKKLLKWLQNREKKVHKSHSGNVLVHDDEIRYLVSGVWRASCALSGIKMGGNKRLELVRWRHDAPAQVDNLVLVAPSAAVKLARLAESGEHPTAGALGVDAAVIAKIEAKLQSIRKWQEY